MPNKYYYWLDAVRFLSALAVVFTHACGFVYEIIQPEASTLYSVMNSICRMNSIVLILFFMLSGFLVGGRNNEIFRTNPDFSVRLFTVKRFIRIIPPLAAASILL